MADRTTGELEAVKVGSLPAAPDIYDDFLMPGEFQGDAVHITGAQWKGYAKEAVKEEVREAGAFADNAKSSADAAAESARDAADVALHPPILKDGNDHWWIWDTALNGYKDSGIDAGVSLEVSPDTVTGEPGTQAKVENLGTKTDPVLKFTIPRGVQGIQGIQGVGVKSAEIIAGTDYTKDPYDTLKITTTDGKSYTFRLYNAAATSAEAAKAAQKGAETARTGAEAEKDEATAQATAAGKSAAAAASSQTAAKTSQDEAAKSQAAALASQNAAKASENAAQDSQEAAQASQNAAAAAQAAAQKSAEDAAGSASEAQDASDAAGQSAWEAAESEANAEASAGEAGTSATASEASAKRAEAAAEAAAKEAAERAAREAETLLEGYVSEASDSKTAAETAAQAAKASQTAAKASQDAAKTSENAALASQTAAAGSAEDAAGSAQAALASQNAAKKSQDAAAASQTAAASSAKTAGEKADAASGSANAAAQSAADAQVSEDAAAQSAQDASTSETNASSSATAAAGSAKTAQTAQAGAVTAQGAAETAKTQAQTAQKGAETARDSAKTYSDSAGESAESAEASAQKAVQYSGNPPKPENGTWWTWNAESGTYTDTGVKSILSIDKSYPSISAMNADFATMPLNTLAIISSNVEEEDNSKLYLRGETEWEYLGDLSGKQGIAGPQGAAAGFGQITATVDAGTGTPGVKVTASGADTAKNFTFAFSNLKGAPGTNGTNGQDGAPGAPGKDGVSPTVKVSKSGTVTTVTFTDASGEKTATINDGKNGTNGTNGAAATITVGSVTTGEAGTSASVKNSGTSTAANLDFVIPKGAKGDTGAKGDKGAKGDAGPNTVSTTTGTDITGLLKGDGTNVAQAVADTDYLTPDTASGTYMPIKGGKFTGNVSGQYFTGTRLQTTAATNLTSSYSKIAVLDNSGWIYYRTPAQILGDIGAVPTSRQINSKALTGDITLGAGDVGAVPTSRKINNKALTGDITLSAGDVGALASGGTAAAATKLADFNINNADLNTLKGSAYWNRIGYAVGGNSCANKPTGVNAFGLLIFRAAQGWTFQLLFRQDTNYVYARRGDDANGWQAWYQIYPASVTNITGNAGTADKLKTARTFPAVNLAGTATASFDGSADPTALGVSGTLPIAHGGTGATSAAAALTNLGGLSATPKSIVSTALHNTPGVFVFSTSSGGDTAASVLPSKNADFIGVQIANSADAFQILGSTSSDARIWVRSNDSGVTASTELSKWSAWKRVASTDSIVAAAKKLATARTFKAVNLAGTGTATFDGSADPAALGVSGTLPVAHGGTGQTSVDTTPTSGSVKMVTSGGVYTALAAKAAKPTVVAVTLAAASWANNAQTVNVSGILADETKQIVNIAPKTTDFKAYMDAGIYVSAVAAGKLTFTCATTPTAALTVYVSIQNV